MSPTATQPLHTRTTQTKDFKRVDIGYGWGRVCSEVGCDCELNHLNDKPVCNPCQLRLRAEGREVPE